MVIRMDVFILSKMVILGVSLAAPVGPVNIEMIKRGISGGFFASWLTGLGAMSADLLFLLSIYVGLATFVEIPAVHLSITFIGTLLLTYLSIGALIAVFKGDLLSGLQMRNDTGASSFFTGFSLALFNPLNFVFWFGIFGSTLSSIPSTNPIETILYSLFILAGIVIWNLNVALTVHFARSLINEKTLRIIMFVCACILFYFALDLLTQLL